MPPVVIDLILLALIALMTYVVSSEGLWGSALVFFNVLFSGIIAFNFYEALAKLLNYKYIDGYADMLCLMLVFLVTLTVLRLTTESIAPSMVRFPMAIYHLGRVIFGFLASALTIAILLLAFDTAPVHKKIFGAVDFKTKPPFGAGFDHQWLAFFQYTTGQVFADYKSGRSDPHREYGSANVFDPRAEWLLKHEQARPFPGGAGALADEKDGDGEAAGGEGAAAKKDAGAGGPAL